MLCGKGITNWQKSKVFDSFHPDSRIFWPKNPEFENLYKKLDSINKDKKYEINRDKIFKKEALSNIFSEKKKYFLYLKKILSYFFLDINSESIKKLLQLLHI